MKKYLIGFIVGICLTVSSNVFAEQVKQFALTLAAYPIFVDGSKYTDTKFPILNYEGSTYVPLAKLGDLTGVNYTWNGSLHRVEIDTDGIDQTIENQPIENSVSTDKTGEYAGYTMLQGYPDDDKYQIYFKGDFDSHNVTIKDLRGIDLNEIITWTYSGKTYKNSKSELYVFFSDTSWLSSRTDDFDYTLTPEWFNNTFGNTYSEWLDGIVYFEEAQRLVNEYFEQNGEAVKSNITLTPDAEFVPVE